jgi:hypothetical protein
MEENYKVPTYRNFLNEGKADKKTLDKQSQKHFNKLVPREGHCKTVEGEMLRAINKIIYRFYNDGDYFWEGYGTETAGPAAAYFMKSDAIPDDYQTRIDKILRGIDGQYKNKYEAGLYEVLALVIDAIESPSGGKLHKNTEDMYNFASLWQNDEDNGEEDEDDYDYEGGY